MSKYRVTVDTGGTFSDFVFFNEESGEITITKVPSTPKEPFQAVLNGVKELVGQGVAARDISFFCHGTTVGTNALLEEKGAKTGLLVTEGFRGIYEVMEQTRGYGPATYDLFFEKPRLLAPPYLTEEIPERVDFKGNALKAIDVEQARQAIRRLKKKDVQSVAVCFLFSFLNPDHELKIKELFAQEFPDARLSLSYEVLPQIREFYRLSTLTRFYRPDADSLNTAPMFCAMVDEDAQAQLNPEHTAFEWVSVDEVGARLMWPSDRQALQEVRSVILAARGSKSFFDDGDLGGVGVFHSRRVA